MVPAIQIAVSVLPDGAMELVDPALLDGLGDDDLFILDERGMEAVDAMLVADNAAGVNYFRGEQYPVVSRDIPTQARYMRMRLRGESHRMAELLATRKFPSFKTDSTFNKGRVCGNQFEDCPLRGDWLKARAEEAGVSTTGRYYSSGLARFPGDPKAWVADRSDVLRVAKENGMTVSGDVNYTAPEADPGEDVDVAPEILAREVDRYLEVNPDTRRGDAEERVRDVITGKVDLNEGPSLAA